MQTSKIPPTCLRLPSKCDALVDEASIEEPDLVTVLHLVDGGDGCRDVTPGGVPLDVCAHEVLGCAENLKVVSREERQLATHGLQPTQYQELTLHTQKYLLLL
jgi:hypothetical protein